MAVVGQKPLLCGETRGTYRAAAGAGGATDPGFQAVLCAGDCGAPVRSSAHLCM